MSRARLLYVVPGREFAGVEHVVHAIASQLTCDYADALDVHVLYATRFAELDGVALAYTAHYLDNHRMRSALPSLARVFGEVKADIIVVAQCEMTALCFLATGFNREGAVFLAHLHGNPAIERTTSLRSQMIFEFYDRCVAPALDGVLAVSRDLAADTRRRLAAGRTVYFAPNPVRAYPQASRHGPPASPARFLNVARLAPQKGQDILLNAFAKVRRALPDATLDLVGAGPDERALRALAEQLDLGSSVRFAGHQADPSEFFAAATCFVLPSRWEGFPLVMIEALSFGLPVVATDCAYGPRELLTDARAGRVIKTGDADALGAAMIEAANHTGDASDFAMRRALAAQFHVERAAAEHFSVLQDAVRTSGKQRQALSAFAQRPAPYSIQGERP